MAQPEPLLKQTQMGYPIQRSGKPVWRRGRGVTHRLPWVSHQSLAGTGARRHVLMVSACGVALGWRTARACLQHWVWPKYSAAGDMGIGLAAPWAWICFCLRACVWQITSAPRILLPFLWTDGSSCLLFWSIYVIRPEGKSNVLDAVWTEPSRRGWSVVLARVHATLVIANREERGAGAIISLGKPSSLWKGKKSQSTGWQWSFLSARKLKEDGIIF